jgi:ribonuclease HIII
MKKNPVKTITLKVSDNTKEKMEEYFEDKKRLKTPPYAVFQADEEDTVITLYESGKAVFQGMSADIDAAMWSQMEKHLNPDKKVEIKKTDNEKLKKENKVDPLLYYCSAIGSDEVGTGDYFGPLVVTAAYVHETDISYLEKLGVKDSKKMTDEKILEIVPLILKQIPAYVVVLSNERYNKVYNEDMNMNKIKAVMHNRALLNMSSKYKYDKIIVDEFAKPYVYYNYLKDAKKVQRNITFTTKGEDASPAVACASLISRYTFLSKMDELSHKLGINLPKGAGKNVDEVGVEIVKKYGFDKLKEISKFNFKNTEKIKELLNDVSSN